MSKPQINVTPLIDVLLVLLIIFMVVTPMKPSAFDAKIPAEPKNDVGVQPNPWTLIVSINSDSTLRLNRNQTTATVDESSALVDEIRATFEARIRNMAFKEGTTEIERTVFIKAPKSLDYGSVAKVIDAVKMAGAAPVSLQIDDLDER